jgi:hypothetical protein
MAFSHSVIGKIIGDRKSRNKEKREYFRCKKCGVFANEVPVEIKEGKICQDCAEGN